MDAQLRLLAEARSADSPEAPAAWRIDATTKAVGRSGIARAREALRQARHRPLGDPAPAGPSVADQADADHTHTVAA
ncbi:hypothetical protein [Rhabdothermincola salaria]|uniref:hypothetical protein n=1 Tax=Rhabdothermincola salaria TaxID=2903142 RepID=UPI001E2EF726|nr:hypothetical protein [Rhabdothermincola salaria]MCD9623569.1 hypothetical protein [Rhabdothermincola salaria]